MIYIDGDGQKTVRFPVDNFMSQARIKAQLLDKEGNERYVTVGWQLIYVMLTLYMIRFKKGCIYSIFNFNSTNCCFNIFD